MNMTESSYRLAWLLRLAALNLTRHARRTLAAVVTVAIGFAALSLFSGYTQDVYQGMRRQAIFSEMLGHFTIFKPGLREQGLLQPERWLLQAEEIDLARQAVSKVAPSARVFPRLAFNGLISNGRVSTIFVAEALAPDDMRVLRGPLSMASGALEVEVANGISVSRMLASLLEVKYQSNVSLLGSTIRGQVNAVDSVVTDTYDTGNLATNDKSLYVPLEQARGLIDAPGMADRLTVVLDDEHQVDALLPLLSTELRRVGLPMTVHPWHKDASAYRQVKSMFDLIFAFMFAILLVICVMALANVVGMNVVERSREIGALRAQGMRQGTVERLFASEALLIIVLGCALGVAIYTLARHGINAAGLGYTPPNATDRVPLTVGLDAGRLAQVTLLLLACGTAAAWWPARRTARQPIVDLLGHV